MTERAQERLPEDRPEVGGVRFLPLVIALGYLLMGSLWILFSDRILVAMVSTRTALARWQTIKGWGYVLVTALLLCLILSFYTSRWRKAQAATLASERRYRRLVQSSDEMIFSVGREGVFLTAAGARLEQYGLTPEDVVGRMAEDVFGVDAQQYRVIHDRVFETGDPLTYEQVIHVGDEAYFEMTTVYPIEKPTGEIEQVGVICRDITERKQVEEALRRSEERLRQAVVESPYPMMLHAEDGEVLIVNKVWTELTGYGPEELSTVGDWMEHAYGERADQMRPSVDRLYELDRRIDEGEYVISTKWGEERTWHFSSAPLGRLPDGRRLVLSIASDVTEREANERALREAERRFRTLLDNVRLVAVGLDEVGNVAYANPYLLELTGYASDEVLGQSWFRIFIPERERSKIEDVFQTTMETGAPPHHENVILTKDGEERRISWNNTLLLDPDGEPVGAMAIGEDVTERKKAEVALQAYRDHLEQLVEERTAELRKMVGLMAGREIRMAELKDAIAQLRAQLEEAGLEPVADDPLLGSGSQ